MINSNPYILIRGPEAEFDALFGQFNANCRFILFGQIYTLGSKGKLSRGSIMRELLRSKQDPDKTMVTKFIRYQIAIQYYRFSYNQGSVDQKHTFMRKYVGRTII